MGRKAPDDARSVTLDDFVGQVLDYAIIRLDPSGMIESWNLGAERLKGYTAEEAIGRSFAMFYPEEDRRHGLPLALLERARGDGRVEHAGWRVRKDGTRFWGDVVITALHDEAGRLSGYAKVTRDLTTQHELEERLRASEERLRLLVRQVVDYAIIALDPHGTIESWNLGAERLTGYPAEEAVGRSFTLLYPEEDRRAGLPMALLEAARSSGSTGHSGWRMRRDGSRFWADVVITALHDDRGALTGYAKVTRDRTDLKTLEDAQDAFYAAFEHDFRTPLTALKGFIDRLRDADEDERDRVIERAEQSADRLLAMVEELVEFATQRSGHLSLHLDDVDLVRVARTAVEDVPPALDPGRVRVARGPASARAHEEAMRRVVTNLVVNSLKYSEPGHPVEIAFDASVPGRVRLSVTDRGRGIDPGDLDTIFDEFVRGRLARSDGGSGLGLASVRELVRQQHGRVWIDSEPGVGTTVVVDLPSVRPATGRAPRPRPVHREEDYSVTVDGASPGVSPTGHSGP